MTPSGDHAAYLAKADFTVPAGADFSPAERDTLAKYGRWLEALADGLIRPTTPSQEQFVRVARGELEPSTPFEVAWAKLARLRAEVVGCFRAFARARAEAAAAEAEYTARRAAVLATVRDQLAEIDAEYAGRIQAATDAVAAGEAAVRELVLRLGQGVHVAGVNAVYHAGRVSWDPKLDAYAEEHPEIQPFRKVGKPWVSLRYTEPTPHPPPRQLPPAGGADPDASPEDPR